MIQDITGHNPVDRNKVYCLDISAKILLEQPAFPGDTILEDLKQKIITKVLCHRENHTIVELKTAVYEGCEEDEEG